MNLTNKAMKEYDIKLKLVQSSEAAMMSELKKAYTKKKPIAVTFGIRIGVFQNLT